MEGRDYGTRLCRIEGDSFCFGSDGLPSSVGGVDFIKSTREVGTRFDEVSIRYALIGGFAMALRGVQRATVDLDFILMLEDLEAADSIFKELGYERRFKNENVSHYLSENQNPGRIDILHAFRGPSLSMLERADRIEVAPGLTLPVVQPEDIIGLKVQAAVNDPRRATSDWADIRMILESSAVILREMDWDLIADYLDVFDQGEKIHQMRDWYGAAE